MKLAVTGGTGFVGSHLIDVALAAGHSVQALTRRDQPPRRGMRWVSGDLEDHTALEHLVDGADAVIHIAGVITGQHAAHFERGNVDGTLAMLAAATAAGVNRFVHVSSLAAREPKLSLYGSSKARSEELVRGSGLGWAIVRPPAVYGPGDRETLELFRMAKFGLMLMPPRGHVSLIHVDDLARLLLALSETDAPSDMLVEPDDGTRGGWTHRRFGRALGKAIGTKPTIVAAPGALMRLAARADQLIRGPGAKLTADRAAYFSHDNWVVHPERACPPDLWRPQISTEEGLRQTADWYRRQGWL
jgi:nucleoside-diphosphate-sugar epimerase